MPVITLPDGKVLRFAQSVSVQAVAESIGPGLAKSALAGAVDNKLVDTSFVIQHDAALSIITDRDPEGLEVMRHSCAHLFAQAMKALYPDTQITIGPVIEDGFYYDFASKKTFTEEDFAAIEKKMQELSAENLVISRKILTREEAIQLFKDKGELYKVEIIKDIPGDEPLSFYQQGDFIDLCRGPHVPSTGKIKVFKLMKVAGAYWRGDAKNAMLQRVYGTCWFTKQDLEAYLHRLEEAEKRDHRKLAKKFDWFHIQEEAPGMIFWHPKGWTIYQAVEQYMRRIWQMHGYSEVRTPQIVDRILWEQSGHWQTYREHMFTLKTDADDRDYAIKPMNCPCHVQIFNQGLKSYRDLPLRLAEFGSCHRNETSGALHGLMRVRSFAQDDAHIFCTEDHIQAEVAAFNALLFKVYKDFGFKDIMIKLSTRPLHRVGSEVLWDKAEQALELALKQTGLDWELAPGDGAFYGPKIDYACKDSLGRIWQCGTMQVDFSMPERLSASYVAEDGSRRIPVMLHRAIFGSLERFIGILIEETAGSFPTWLAPIQVVVLNITDVQADFVKQVVGALKKQGFRVQEDLRNEKIGFKIREHAIQRVPYLLVVGDREVKEAQVAVRTRNGRDLGLMTIEEFSKKLAQDIEYRWNVDTDTGTEE